MKRMAVKHIFNGRAEKVAKGLVAEGQAYGISIGRRAPMHRMHMDCVLEIAAAGLTPVIIVGSTNSAESEMFQPLKNPLTAEQQKEQIRQALDGNIDHEKVKVVVLDDHPDDNVWMQNLAAKAKDLGIDDKSVIHFRAKSADAEKEGDPIKPLNSYAQAFISSGFSVWHSYNSRAADDSICASDIREFDLERLTPEQRSLIAAPDYIIAIARKAREDNPDRTLLDQHNVPVTLFDLTLDRLHREAGIRTADVFDAIDKSQAITQDCLKKVANDIILKYIAPKKGLTAPENASGKKSVERKPILILGDSVSPETARTLGDSGIFENVPAALKKYKTDEQYVEFTDSAINAEKIKGAKVVIVQSTGEPVGDHVQHLLEMIHTAKFYGAAEVTAVIPFAAFARQDRPFDKRLSSVSADLFAKMLKAAGADKITTFTMHSQAAIKFYKDAFGDNFINVSAADAFTQHFKKDPVFKASDLIVGAPDGAEKLQDEGQRRARELSETLTGTFNEKSMFRISKVHTEVNETKITHFDGDVAGKDCIIIDDMIDGGTTMLNAAKILKENGAKSVTCGFTHALLTDGAGTLQKLLTPEWHDAPIIDKLVMTDSIPEAAEKVATFAKSFPALAQKIEVISLGDPILAKVGQKTPAVPAANGNTPKTRCKFG